TNGEYADLVIVVCKTDPRAGPAQRGISLLVVEAGMEGFSRGKKLNKVGQHASDSTELLFEDVRAPKETLLGEEGRGFYYLMKNLQQERLMVAISSIPSAENMVDLTIDYVKERRAFGQTMNKYQIAQCIIDEMQTE